MVPETHIQTNYLWQPIINPWRKYTHWHSLSFTALGIKCMRKPRLRGDVTCPGSHELMVEPGQELRSPIFSSGIFSLPYHAFLRALFVFGVCNTLLSWNYFHSLEIGQLPVQHFLSGFLQWSLRILWSAKVWNYHGTIMEVSWDYLRSWTGVFIILNLESSCWCVLT